MTLDDVRDLAATLKSAREKCEGLVGETPKQHKLLEKVAKATTAAQYALEEAEGTDR